jgi:ABC-type transport system involved in cytochrome c biogenesis permease component
MCNIKLATVRHVANENIPICTTTLALPVASPAAHCIVSIAVLPLFATTVQPAAAATTATVAGSHLLAVLLHCRHAASTANSAP